MGNSSSQLGSSSTAQQVVDVSGVDLKGKNVVVTGATTGIGKETTRVLLESGCNVFAGCRNEEKASILKNELIISDSEGENKRGTFVPVIMDQSSLASVRDAAKSLLNEPLVQDRGLDALILNAGVMINFEKKTTQDNFELQFGVNHLSHFLFTKILLPALRKKPTSSTLPKEEARIVVVASNAHNFNTPDIEDYNFEKRSVGASAYADSKSYNIMFSNYLNSLLETENSNEGVTPIFSNSLHPGVISTDLGRQSIVSTIFLSMGSKSIPQGAATSVYAAISPDLKGIGGKYLADCAIGNPGKHVQDVETQKKLWELSERLIASFLE